MPIITVNTEELCTTVKLPENKFWRTNINIVQKKDTEGENSSAPEPPRKRLEGQYADAGFVELTQNGKIHSFSPHHPVYFPTFCHIQFFIHLFNPISLHLFLFF